MQRHHHLPDRDRLSVLTAIILLSFVLARSVQLPTRPVRAMLFGSSIGVDVNGPFVLLVLVAIGMFAAEVKVTSYGLLTLGGIAAMILGALMLVDAPIPELRVSLGTLVALMARV